MSPNKEHQWRNLLGCDHWVLAGTPRPKTVGFRNLVRVAIAPVSKKLAVKGNFILPRGPFHVRNRNLTGSVDLLSISLYKTIAKLKKRPIEFQLFNGFYLSRQSRKKEKTSFDGSKPPTKKIGDKLTFHEEPSLNPQSCI